MSAIGPVEIETRLAVLDLLAEAAHLLDEDRLEDWVDCFAEEAIYRILSRENEVRGLPLPLFQCENKDMLRDRVLALRRATVINIHRDRHIVGPVRLALEPAPGILVAQSSYALFQIDQEGIATLFGVGSYRDRIRISGGCARFVERLVMVDSYSIPTMLSTPI